MICLPSAPALAANPRAALVLYWRELDRQVRVRGMVTRISAADSDEYFAIRPRDSQIGAAVSPQSRSIERDELDRPARPWWPELRVRWSELANALLEGR